MCLSYTHFLTYWTKDSITHRHKCSVKCYDRTSLLPLYCLSTASLLPLYCLSTASLLPLYCLSTASLLPLYCLSTASLLPLYCLSTASLLPLYCLSTASLLPLLFRCYTTFNSQIFHTMVYGVVWIVGMCGASNLAVTN